MSYFPVDDEFTFHPKAIAAGNEALGVWVRAGAWSKKYTTGGTIPRDVAHAIGTKRACARLVAAGLWIETEDAYLFHDWTQQAGNGTAEVEKDRQTKARESNAKRQRDFRARNGEGNGVTNGSVTSTPSPSPRPKDRQDTQRQSRTKSARPSTDAEVSPMTARLAGQRGITSLPAVADAIAKHTGREVTTDQAFQVAIWILDKAKADPRAPQRYVTTAISRSPFEIQQHIDTAVAS